MAIGKDRPRERALVAAALAAAYLLFGALWIVYSDKAGHLLFGTPEALTRYQTWKGLGFIGATTLFVYLVAAWAAGQRVDGPGPANGTPHRGLSVARLLALLVLATALPMVALLVWHAQRETQSQLEAAQRLVRTLARTTAEEAHVFLGVRMRLAAALADRPEVRAMSPERCDPLLVNLPEIDAVVQEVAAFDLKGQAVCGSAPRTPTRLPGWEQRLRDGRGFVDSIARDPADGAWSFALVHPVHDSAGELRGAIEVVFHVGALIPIVAGPVPEGGVVALLDPSLTLAGRFPALPNGTGMRVTDPEAVERLAVADGESYVTTGLDGVRRLYAAYRVQGTDWVASAGVPLQDLYAPAREALLRSVLAGLVILVFSSFLVVRLARSLTAPIRALQRTAAAAAQGDFSHRAPEGGPAELAALGVGMNRMLEQLPRLQQAVAESEARMREQIGKLSRNLPDMIFVLESGPGRARRLVFASEAIRTLLELGPQDVAEDATPALHRIHWLDRERIERGLEAAERAQVSFTAEFRVELPRGGLRHLLARAQPEPGEPGRTVWFGALTDVTELRVSRQALAHLNETLEQRIAERTAELAQANEALESFSYSVAHDLRAPLASISGFAEVVADSLKSGNHDRALALSGRVTANAARMNAMIEAFLSLARVGRGPLVEASADLGRMVAEVLEELPRPPQARVEVAPLPRVLADPAMLRQVWQNLLSNALKYSGGRDQPRVTVDWTQDADGSAVFRVADNGVGFDPDYGSRLFTPFSRLHKADEFEGTGIGLSLVRRIVERHGGRAWAQAVVGEGATFCFSLPRARVVLEEDGAEPVDESRGA